MTIRWKWIALLTCAAAVTAFAYLLPYRTFDGIRSAAQSEDPLALGRYVDARRLRNSVSASLGEYLDDTAAPPAATSLVDLATAFGSTREDRMAESLTSPRGIRLLLAGVPPREIVGDRGVLPDVAIDGDAHTHMGYESFGRFVVWVQRSGAPDTASLGLEIRREGLFEWKLASLRLPR